MPKSPEFEALEAEMLAIQAARGVRQGVEAKDRDGEVIVAAANGEAAGTTHEEALAALVDAHRTKVEDAPEFYETLLPVVDGDVRAAVEMAQALACEARCAARDAGGDEAAQDAAVVAARDARVAQHAVEVAAQVAAAQAAADAAAAAAAEAAAQAAANADTPEQLAEAALRGEWMLEEQAAAEARYQAWKAAKLGGG